MFRQTNNHRFCIPEEGGDTLGCGAGGAAAAAPKRRAARRTALTALRAMREQFMVANSSEGAGYQESLPRLRPVCLRSPVADRGHRFPAAADPSRDASTLPAAKS